MTDKKPFGSIKALDFSPGDLVKWSKWNVKTNTWEKKYGIVIKMVNQSRTNRLVSVSHVYVFETASINEFFTLSLKKVKDKTGN